MFGGFSTNASSYTQFNFPITYSLNEYLDTASIIITISYTGSHPNTGTQFYVDDLSLAGTVSLGIKQNIGDSNITIYPNPSNGSFVIEATTNEKQALEIFDVTSKMVLSQSINGKTSIDVSTLDNGIYFVQVKTKENTSTKKLLCSINFLKTDSATFVQTRYVSRSFQIQ